MAKLENLLMLVHLLLTRRSVDIDTIQMDCSVSRRTAFRYIESLQVAGFPIVDVKEPKGYGLLSRTGALTHLTPSELSTIFIGIELLKSVLKPTNLEVFRRIEVKLEAYITKEVQSELMAAVKTIGPDGDTSGLREHLLLNFLKTAQQEHRRIRLSHSAENETLKSTEISKPCLLFESEWKLRMEDGSDQDDIALSKIVDIEFV